MSHAYVIGLGKSGIAAARLLKRDGWQVTISDRNDTESLQQQRQALKSEAIAIHLGESFQPELVETLRREALELIVVSPGVPWDLPALVHARQVGIETIGEMELGWRHLQHIPWVGITGTNGKTTTTALIAAIFQAAGYHAPAFGNIGLAACEVALATKQPDWAIAELSSYQIEAAPSIAPRIGIWTTFTADHLSRHKTLENYFNIKASLLSRTQVQIFNGDDAYLRSMAAQGAEPFRPTAGWTSTTGQADLLGDRAQGVYIEDGWVRTAAELVMPANLLRMVGKHNQQNLLMAVAAARSAGIAKNVIVEAIAAFPGVPHRLESICAWRGVEFVNDSKATNYDAAAVGLAAVKAPVILIAGGEAKIGDDAAWIATIQHKAAAVVLIGNAAPTFAQRLAQVGYDNYEIVETMERAVPRSADLAIQHQAAVVLLSPACASFDQFENFEQRGDRFRQLCLAHTNCQR
jgi:UDP-N-acetylmuramoylalanine--D-glutamate ligase